MTTIPRKRGRVELYVTALQSVSENRVKVTHLVWRLNLMSKAIYSILDDLVKMGLLERLDPPKGDKRTQYIFALTPEGKQALKLGKELFKLLGLHPF